MASRVTYDHQFEEALNKVKNRFLFSVVLAKRVAQLRKGAEPLVNSQGLGTYEEIVFREIIEDKLEWRESAVQEDVGDMEQEFSSGDFDDVGE
ncbi:DNA-directed RNA polymerase subunit omega [Nitrospinota bacterium]